MNKIISYIGLFCCLSLVLISCSSDDNTINNGDVEVLQGKNDVTITFTHKMFGDDIVYNKLYDPNGNNEQLNIQFLKYIVSNFELTDNKGKVFTYPKDEGYFFVDTETNDLKVTLKDVPAGYYTKVKFGIGVDQEKYLRGESDQQEFWDLCREHDLIWGWITGYKFINCEGFFTNGEAEEDDFKIHIGSHGSKLDNYRELSLVSNEDIKVSDMYSAQVNLDVEVSLLLDGKNKISLKGNEYIMIDAKRSPLIIENATTMFKIRTVESK